MTGLAAVRQKRGEHKPKRINAPTKVDGNGADTMIWIGIPKAQLEQARPGTGQHRSVGFTLYAEFTIPGDGTYALRSPWVNLIVP